MSPGAPFRGDKSEGRASFYRRPPLVCLARRQNGGRGCEFSMGHPPEILNPITFADLVPSVRGSLAGKMAQGRERRLSTRVSLAARLVMRAIGLVDEHFR